MSIDRGMHKVFLFRLWNESTKAMAELCRMKAHFHPELASLRCSPELSQQCSQPHKMQLTDTASAPQGSYQSQLKPLPVSHLGKQGHSSFSSCSGDFQRLHYSELDRCFVSALAQLLGTNCFWFSTQIKSIPYLNFLIGKRPEANSRKIVPDSLSQSRAVTYLRSRQRMLRVRCFQHCLEKKDHEVLMRTQSDVTLSCSASVQGYWENKLKILLTVGTLDQLWIFDLRKNITLTFLECLNRSRQTPEAKYS